MRFAQALTDAEYAAFAARFGLDRSANFEGHWHLHVFQIDEEKRGVRSSQRARNCWPFAMLASGLRVTRKY